MNYNSCVFWAMFAVVFARYWRLSHRRQNDLLLVASYVFYGFWDYRFLFLILVSTVIDFIGGLGVAGRNLSQRRLNGLGLVLVLASLLLCGGIHYGNLAAGLIGRDSTEIASALPHSLRDTAIPLLTVAVVLIYGRLLPLLYSLPEQRRRRWFLTISITANLAILAFFKYFGFFYESLRELLSTTGLGALGGLGLHIVLPIGISFYTFQAMSYTIDIYRKEVEPTESFRDFALFVCFFPHLVAGPIMRAHTLLPQVTGIRERRSEDLVEGAALVALGLFKKLVIADNMAPLVNAVFHSFQRSPASVTGLDILIGVYAFAFQIYGDFSGYSSIARGVSKWLGFELIVNFHQPYLATSPSDFWRRWHISLSTWLRDYLYISLGGNRRGRVRTYANLLITMLLGGLWHGAAWTYVAWGAFHGALLCLFRAAGVRDPRSDGPPLSRLYWLVRVVIMFHLTCIGWLLFRAPTISAAFGMLTAVFTRPVLGPLTVAMASLVAMYCAPLMLLEWYLDGEGRVIEALRSQWVVRGSLAAYILVMLVVFHAERSVAFIYFQF